MANTPLIETSRLILRRWTAGDVSALRDILSDREVNRFLPWFPIDTLSEAGTFLNERFLSYYTLPEAYRYAVCLRESDIPIGYINIACNDSRDLGYGLAKKYWNNGYMTEAAKALLERARQDKVPYITATHDILNPASGKVMKGAGMEYRYTYTETVMPKNETVTFRMYCVNWRMPQGWEYTGYSDRFPWFREEQV